MRAENDRRSYLKKQIGALECNFGDKYNANVCPKKSQVELGNSFSPRPGQLYCPGTTKKRNF